MSRPRVLGATLAWLVVVASVSALVWVVISRAGDDLVSSEQPLLTTGDAPSGSTSSSPGRPRRTPTPSRTASPNAEPTASPTDEPSTTPPPSPPVVVERRTWQGRPGSLVVECGATGSRLVSAQPANGFRAEVKDEDGLPAVEFEGREEESGIEVTVVARCVDGIPTFSVASSDD